MIEVTIRLKGPAQGRRLAAQLRALAAIDPDRGQAKMYRGTAKRLERIPRYATTRPTRPAHTELDDEAIERVVKGLLPLPKLSREEARTACFRLTERGCSTSDIAHRVGATERTVTRWRAENRTAVPA